MGMDVNVLVVGLGMGGLEIFRRPFPVDNLPQLLLDGVGNLGACRTGNALYLHLNPSIRANDKFYGFHRLLPHELPQIVTKIRENDISLIIFNICRF